MHAGVPPAFIRMHSSPLDNMVVEERAPVFKQNLDCRIHVVLLDHLQDTRSHHLFCQYRSQHMGRTRGTGPR